MSTRNDPNSGKAQSHTRKQSPSSLPWLPPFFPIPLPLSSSSSSPPPPRDPPYFLPSPSSTVSPLEQSVQQIKHNKAKHNPGAHKPSGKHGTQHENSSLPSANDGEGTSVRRYCFLIKKTALDPLSCSLSSSFSFVFFFSILPSPPSSFFSSSSPKSHKNIIHPAI